MFAALPDFTSSMLNMQKERESFFFPTVGQESSLLSLTPTGSFPPAGQSLRLGGRIYWVVKPVRPYSRAESGVTASKY